MRGARPLISMNARSRGFRNYVLFKFFGKAKSCRCKLSSRRTEGGSDWIKQFGERDVPSCCLLKQPISHSLTLMIQY